MLYQGLPNGAEEVKTISFVSECVWVCGVKCVCVCVSLVESRESDIELCVCVSV